MKLVKDIKKMCTPAIVYLLLSVFSLLVLVFSNLGNRTTLCVGEFDCPVDNVFVVFVVKALYIAFVTIVLDSLCKNGWGAISWFLVFLPIFFFFVVLGLFMIYQNHGTNQTIVLVEQEQMI
jgi:hypothetical protein